MTSLYQKIIRRALLVFLLWQVSANQFPQLANRLYVACVLVQAAALGLFTFYLLGRRFGFGHAGTTLLRASVALLVAYVLAYVTNPGFHGPEGWARFFVFRLALVLMTGLVAYHLTRFKFFTPKNIPLYCVTVTSMFLGSVLAGRIFGYEWVEGYSGNLRAVGVEGIGIEGQILAFCIPGIALLANPFIRSIAIGANLVLILFAYERTAQLCAMFSIIVLFLSGKLSEGRTALRFVNVALAIFFPLLAVLHFGSEKMTSRWIELFQGTSSGFSQRDMIYPTLLDGIASDTKCWMFGHGIGSTLVATDVSHGIPRYAHNDWIEITYTAGFTGLIAFLWLHLAILKGLRYLFLAHSQILFFGICTYGSFLLGGMTNGKMFSASSGPLLFAMLGAICAFADNALEEPSLEALGSKRSDRATRYRGVCRSPQALRYLYHNVRHGSK